MSEVHVMDHPLIQHKISYIRREDVGTKEFREVISEIASLMCTEETDRRYDTWWTQRIGGDKNARKDSNFDHGCCFCCLPRPDHDRTEKYRRAGTDYGTGRTGRLADTLVYLQQ